MSTTVELRTVTVAEIIAKYRQHAESVKLHCEEAASIRASVFRRFLETCGHLPIGEAKPFHLRDFIESQTTFRSSSTKRAAANMIRAAFEWAAQEERIERNPFRVVKYPEAMPREPMPRDMLNEIITRTSCKCFERVLRFLWYTGCRVSELCVLKWPNVDLEQGYCILARHKSFRYTRRAKTLILISDAVALLASMRALDSTSNGFVFVNNRGLPWNRNSLAHALKRMKSRGDIDTHHTLHSIRHGFATHAIAAGAPVKLISEALGHANSTFTELRYASHVNEHHGAIRAAIQQGLSGGK